MQKERSWHMLTRALFYYMLLSAILTGNQPCKLFSLRLLAVKETVKTPAITKITPK